MENGNSNGVVIAEQKPPQTQPRWHAVQDESDFANFLDTNKFEHLYRVATLFSKSDLVPQHYRGKPENCMLAIQMAIRCNVDPLMFMQKSYIVGGKPGIEATLAIALCNSAKVFTGRIRYRLEGAGEKRQCTAFATLADCGETVEQTVSMAVAKAEGWLGKNGSKWLTIPDLMLQYRSAMWLIRINCPEVIMGLQSKEELQDEEPAAAALPRAPRQPRMSIDDALSIGVETSHEQQAATTETPKKEPAKEPQKPTTSDDPGEIISMERAHNLIDKIESANIPPSMLKSRLKAYGAGSVEELCNVKADELSAWLNEQMKE